MMSDFVVQPVHNNILIKKVDLIEETKIVLPGEKEQTQNTARVLAVGPGRYHGDTLIPVSVKPGDLIITGGHVSVYRVAGEEFCLISDNSVVGLVDESKVKVSES
jgi:co-chaperonin GroES (HSP10)